jgi:MoaA/NifB/PqqE/SkfB family radical SAM enzyme
MAQNNNTINVEEVKNHPVFKQYGESFCCAPWNTVWTSSDGNVKFCCASSQVLGNIKNESVINIMNNDIAKGIRKEFLDKQKPKSCESCWETERGGPAIGNPRWLSNQQGQDVIVDSLDNTNVDGHIEKHNLKFVDLIWTNKCNLACLHCQPDISSAIADSYKEVFPIWLDKKPLEHYDIYKTSAVVDNSSKLNYVLDNCDKLEQIHFNGGEPLMQEETFELIEELMKRGLNKQINLWFHTNGSIRTYKGVDIVEDYLGPWGKNCKITMSHDHFGKRGEYFRYGYHEGKWLENFDRFHNAGIEMTIQTSFTLFNTITLPELAEWYVSNNISSRAGMKLTYVSNPYVWNFLNLGKYEEFRDKTKLALSNSKQLLATANWINSIDNCLNLLDQPFDYNEVDGKFVKGIDALDVKRKTKFLETFPELAGFYNQLKNKNLM